MLEPSTSLRRLARTKRWTVTVAATVVSTYLLDMVATAAGVALAASHLLRGVDHWLIVAFLVASYVVWGAGLRVSLAANWTLLEETGTSTSAVSKAAYDLAGLGRRGDRFRRTASQAELAKEIPYYAGAFGAALVSDSVSSNDALVFLAGANLGAAAYEYALGRLTRTFLRLRARTP